MEFSDRKNCSLDGRSFPNGAEIVAKAGIMDCVNGKWEKAILVSGI